MNKKLSAKVLGTSALVSFVIGVALDSTPDKGTVSAQQFIGGLLVVLSIILVVSALGALYMEKKNDSKKV